jgi:hypothetical protein
MTTSSAYSVVSNYTECKTTAVSSIRLLDAMNRRVPHHVKSYVRNTTGHGNWALIVIENIGVDGYL